ncbi:hypothetical protein [Paraburkholderia sp. A1RO-5L]|uniref:hypothetical protein n=1 Tax=unclassified Paraburkholderia TaxID=2615204 RepID=UPI003B7A538C
MLTTRELMMRPFLDGPSCAEACEWLHDADSAADTRDLIEYALDAYSGGELGALPTVANIARALGLPADAVGKRGEP